MDRRAVHEDPGAAVLDIDDLVHPIERSCIHGLGSDAGLVNAHESQEERGQREDADGTRGLQLDQDDQRKKGGAEQKLR